MKQRFRGFEFEDQPWFPSFLRQYMMDFLRFVLHAGNLYQPITPVLVNALQHTNSPCLVDLCSGAGGAVQSIQQNIKKSTGRTIPFILTDLYPNLPSYRRLQHNSKGSISFYAQPVDAAAVPAELTGLRTLFSGFHHFDEKTACRVLQNAAASGEGIAIFDGGSRSLWFMLSILLLQPIGFLLLTPFIKPFSWRRILFTYLIPVVPFCTIWDGIVSTLRLYTPAQMQQLATAAGVPHYHWQAGLAINKFGIRIAWLTGYPKAGGLN